MDADTLRALLGPAGQAALDAATNLGQADPLVAVESLRRAGVAADLASAALTQLELRRRAAAKFGPDADRLYFTRAGLEQATRAVVAARRAERIAKAGITAIADLGCGIGADSLAFARAGLRVLAVEADPVTAAVAAANAAALSLTDRLTVRAGTATEVDLSDVDAVFCDPARRDQARGRRIFDPDAFSPSWDFVTDLHRRVPATVLKLAPGIDHALIPAGAEAEWVSVDGDVVEAAIWCGPLAEVPRRATVLRGVSVARLSGTGERTAAVAPVRDYLFDPDGAVVRSHLVAEFADAVHGTLADPHIAYVFADRPAATPLGRCFAVEAHLPYPLKRLRPALHERGVGQLEIRKRGVGVEPDQLRRDLRLSGPESRTLVLTRIGTTPTALLCRAVPA
ncbi:MAG TPA: class I SAM-dependent methyltransferase [Micromonosporaceae bacterium]